jgi:hypothetical protein
LVTSRSFVLLIALVTGCAIVPQKRRAHWADPMLRLDSDRLDAHRRQKLYSTREAASGGDGQATGAGCSCR